MQSIKIEVEMTDLNKYLIFNFVTGERTKGLSNYCFQQLGFENIINIENNESFHKKYLKFAELAVESNFDYFIRSDADRLVFDGLIDLIKYYESNKELSNITGKFFDYFMNKFRGGTPSFFKRNTLEENLKHSLEGTWRVCLINLFVKM